MTAAALASKLLLLPALCAFESLEIGPEVGALPVAEGSALSVAVVASLFKGAAPSEPSALSDKGPCGVDGESRVISLMSNNDGLNDDTSLGSQI